MVDINKVREFNPTQLSSLKRTVFCIFYGNENSQSQWFRAQIGQDWSQTHKSLYPSSSFSIFKMLRPERWFARTRPVFKPQALGWRERGDSHRLSLGSGEREAPGQAESWLYVEIYSAVTSPSEEPQRMAGLRCCTSSIGTGTAAAKTTPLCFVTALVYIFTDQVGGVRLLKPAQLFTLELIPCCGETPLRQKSTIDHTLLVLVQS